MPEEIEEAGEEVLVYPCDKIKKYLDLKGFRPTSYEYEGLQRWDKVGHDFIFLTCINGISVSYAKTITNRTMDDFESFERFIASL